MARGKNPCKLCVDRAANVKGGICHVCAETVEGKAFLTGEPAEAEPKRALVDDPAETDLEAMDRLWRQQGKPKTVLQAAWAYLYKEGAKAFQDRMERFRSSAGSQAASSVTSNDSVPPPKWDGTGACPTCHRVEIAGPEYMQPEWGEVLRLSREATPR